MKLSPETVVSFDWNIDVYYDGLFGRGWASPYHKHLDRIIEKGARADLYLATRFPRPIIWDVELGEEAAPIRLRPMAHVATLSIMALCAAAYWVGFLSGPFGIRGLVLFTSILVAGWGIGVITGYSGAMAAGGTT